MRIGKIGGPTFINTNPSNLLSNGDFKIWSNGVSQPPDDWMFYTTSMTGEVAREDTIKRFGDHSVKLTLGEFAYGCLVAQLIETNIEYWRGRTITFGCWVWTDVSDSAVLGIWDQVTGLESTRHPGDSTWRWISITHKVDIGSTRLDIYCDIYQPGSAYFDGAMLVEGESSFAFSEKPVTQTDIDNKVNKRVINDGSVNPTNLLTNGNFEDWSNGDSSAPDGWYLWEDPSVTGVIAKESSVVKIGSYSAKFTKGTDSCFLNQDIAPEKGLEYWKGRKLTFGCWVWSDELDNAEIGMTDGVTGWGTRHNGDSTWQWLTGTFEVSPSAVIVQAYLGVYGMNPCYFDGAIFVEGDSAFAFNAKPGEEKIHQLKPITDGVKAIKFTRAEDPDPTYVAKDFLIINTIAGKQAITIHQSFNAPSEFTVLSKWFTDGTVPEGYAGTKGDPGAQTVYLTSGDTTFMQRGRMILWGDGETDIITSVIDSTTFTVAGQSYKSTTQSISLRLSAFTVNTSNIYGGSDTVGIGTAFPEGHLQVAGWPDPQLVVGSSSPGSGASMAIGSMYSGVGWLQTPYNPWPSYEDSFFNGLILGFNAKMGTYGWETRNRPLAGQSDGYPLALTLSSNYNNYPPDNTETHGLMFHAGIPGDQSLRNVFKVTSFGRIGINNPHPLCRLHINDWSGWRGNFSAWNVDGHLNDFMLLGVYTSDVERAYQFKISSISPDKFQWSNDDGSTWSSEIDIPGDQTEVNIEYGLKVRFISNTGHILNDYWRYYLYPNYGQFVIKEGRVGVQTDSPDEALDVRGNIRTTRSVYTDEINSVNWVLNGDFERWSSGDTALPDNWGVWHTGTPTLTYSRERTIVKNGSSSLKLTREGGDDSYFGSNDITVPGRGLDYWKGRSITLGGWVYATEPNKANLYIWDGVGVYSTDFHTGDGTWQWLSVTAVIDINAYAVTANCWVTGVGTGDSASAYFDALVFTTGNLEINSNVKVNGELSIKVYSQDDEPTLEADNRLAMWIDTNDSNRVYILFKRGTGDQVAVELS